MQPLPRDQPAEVVRISHLDVVGELLATRSPDPSPPDLVILAHAEPDENGHQTVASYLNWQTGGLGHSFAVCASGTAAPFAALRMADAYRRSGRSRQALIGVVDCPSGAPATGALLPLGGSGWTIAAITAGSPAHLETLLAGYAEGSQLLLIVDESAADQVAGPAGTTRHVAAGRRCTAVWGELTRLPAPWLRRFAAVALCSGADDLQLAVLRR
jgi:hypothetical protein